MIRAHMTEAEILAEAKDRLAYQKKFSMSMHQYTLEENIDFVRSCSAHYDEIEEKALPFIDKYYQMFVDGIDEKKWKKWETQNFYHRVVRNSINKECYEKERQLRSRIGKIELYDDNWKLFKAGQKEIGREAEILCAAARMAFYKYAEEIGFTIKSGVVVGPAWESQMIADLESRTDAEIM